MEQMQAPTARRKSGVNVSTSPRICPNGCGYLAPLSASGFNVERCYICGGIYLDSATVDTLRRLPEADAATIERTLESQAHAANMQQAKAAQRRTDPRPCPNCRTLMLPYAVQYRVTITLDHCGTCEGYWADDQELEAISIPLDSRHHVRFDGRDSEEFRNEVALALHEADNLAAGHKPSSAGLGAIFPTLAAWVRRDHA